MAGEKTFTLGITMAGAVSAGAYTAGVLDFLIRAIDAHNARVGQPGGPEHKVALKVMSGASAGGISAALAVAALVEGIETLHDGRLEVGRESGPNGERNPKEAQDYRFALRVLHEMWVKRVDLTQGDRPMLGRGDLTDDKEVISLINSEVLDAQADEVLETVRASGKRYDWLAEELDLFLSTTDLDGVPFTAPFAAGGSRIDGHPMARHAFARHFRVTGLGAQEIGSPWLEAWGDAGVPLSPPAKGEPVPFTKTRDLWCELKITALASGAFPAGLASRFLNLTADEIYVAPGETGRGGAMPIDVDPARRPKPSHPFFEQGAAGTYVLHAVDGGVCNNEPFELARFTLRPRRPGAEPGDDDWLSRNPPKGAEADRAVIMIDPFPEGPTFDASPKLQSERGFFASLGKLVPTLLDEARFKPMELLRAADPEVYSRWLVAPSRNAAPGELDDAPWDSRRRYRQGRDANADGLRDGARGAEAIASGLLGGFGGFLDESFRAHDFVLGQRNCRSFLKYHFRLPASNPIVRREGEDAAGPGAGESRPIVTLEGELAEKIPLPPWPVMPEKRVKRLRRMIEARFDKIVKKSTRSLGWGGAALNFLWNWKIDKPSVDAVMDKIEGELKARDQI